MKIIITETVTFTYDVPDPSRLTMLELPTTAVDLVGHDVDDIASKLEEELQAPHLQPIVRLTGLTVHDRDVRAEYTTPAIKAEGDAA